MHKIRTDQLVNEIEAGYRIAARRAAARVGLVAGTSFFFTVSVLAIVLPR